MDELASMLKLTTTKSYRSFTNWSANLEKMEKLRKALRGPGLITELSWWVLVAGEDAPSKLSRRTPHSLKVIVHSMLSQFYGVFLGFHLGWETNWILQVKFPLFPRDNCMSSPDSLFIIRRDRDYVAMMYDVFHREESKTAT
jgi:hypothetical protein